LALTAAADAQNKGKTKGKADPKAGTSSSSGTGKGEVQFVGKKANGKFGALAQTEARDWIVSKLPTTPSDQLRSNASACVSDVVSGRGKATGPFKHQGAPILHVSNGAGDTGCTLFYVLKQTGDQPKGGKAKAKDKGGAGKGKAATSSTSTMGKPGVQAVKVVGIGHHVGPTTYDLGWRDPSSGLPNRLDLSR